jgi:hypothetical protein
MQAKLTTIINKIQTVPNLVNAEIIDQFYHYMIEFRGYPTILAFYPDKTKYSMTK